MRGGASHLRGRFRPLAAWAAVLLLAGAGGALSGAFASALEPEAPDERILLRLNDLPPGYVPLDLGPEGTGVEFECAAIDPSDPSPRLGKYLERYKPEGCFGVYLRAYRVPGPSATALVVGTGVLEAGSVAGASAGLAATPMLMARLVEREGTVRQLPATATVGEETRLFHWRHIPHTFLHNSGFGSFLAWRSGKVVAIAFASARSLAESDRIALELARRQQVHVEHPTVYAEAERDHSEVGLDNPTLTFPVRWLGHDFTPGHGLPPAELQDSSAIALTSNPKYRQLMLRYNRGIEIEGWIAADWKRFLATREGRLLTADNCAEPVAVPLTEGRAKVFTGAVLGYASCKHSPKRYYAIAHVGGTVLAVNFTGCADCGSRGPYNSLKGMKTIVRGLELRPKPVY